MKVKRVLSWALCLMMVFAMIPSFSVAIYAEDGGVSPAISIGAGNIEKGNKVYMGCIFVEANAEPISWLVLGNSNSTNLTDGNSSVNAENARLLILTEKTQDDYFFDEDENNEWQGSDIQNWCNIFLNESDWNGQRYQKHFSGLEKETMLYTSKTDVEDYPYGESSLDNERLFLLSAEEVSDDYGYFNGNDSRIAYKHDSGEAGYWWLRSPCMDYSIGAACVYTGGYIGFQPVTSRAGARPAFNINLNAVLFTSAAVGGKSSGTVGANAFNVVPDKTTNEWKMTLHYTGRDGFEASAATGAVLSQDEGYTSWSIPIVYSGASAARDNDYVSVILCDSNDNALYYGNIANKTAASSAAGQDVNIPAGLTAGDYKLYVFSEERNADKLSDYASAFKTINLKVNGYQSVPAGKTLTYNGKSQTGVAAGTGYTLSGTTTATNAGSYKATATLNEGYVWSDDSTEAKTISWKINAKAITPAVTLSTKEYTYNGKVRKPTVTVKEGSTKFADSQYDVTYASGRKNVGTYKVTVKMKGNYSGSKTVSFKINPKGTTLSGVTKGKKAATIKWKKQAAKMSTSRITGYQIQLACDSKFTKNKKTVNVKGYSKTLKKITGLKGGKRYYVQIRTYKKVGNTTYYSSWSKAKTVTTGK